LKRIKTKCSECPLRDQKKVYSEGPLGANIMFIGEAPGETEVAFGKPFIGKAGGFFNYGLINNNINRGACYIANCSLCMFPRNDETLPESIEALENCKEGLFDEIKRVNPNVICCLGATAAKILGLKGSITSIRGSVYFFEGIPVVPTYHPSHIDRMRMAKDDSDVSARAVWFADLCKVKRLGQERFIPLYEDFNTHPTKNALCNRMLKAIKSKSPVAVDIETAGDAIVVIGLGFSATEGWSVPILKQYGLPYWEPSELRDIRVVLNRLFTECPLYFQNAMFDVKVLRRHGFIIPWSSIKHDTMLLHHVVSPELLHNLGFITSIYGMTPYWKDTLKLRPGSILDMDDGEVRPYNLRDCVTLPQIIPPMLDEIIADKTEDIYYNESMKLIKPIMKMEDRGIKLNVKRLEKFAIELQKEITSIETEMKSLGNLPDAFSFTSDDDIRYFLFGILPNKLRKVEDEISSKKRTDTKVYRELLQKKELKEKTKPLYLLTGWGGRRTDSGRRSVNDKGILAYRIQLNNRLERIGFFKRRTERVAKELTDIRTLCDWLEKFSEYKELKKLLSTYTTFPMDADDRIHSSFLIHGTVTGRLASRNPNLQNIPKKRDEIRRCFIPADGFVFVSFDYSNLEVKILAYITGDKNLIKTVETSNVHDENTKTLFGILPDNPLWDTYRRAAKVYQFGKIQYGGSDREIFENIVTEVPEIPMTLAQFKQMNEKYFADHPEQLAWYAEVEKIAIEQRYVTTPFGRKRILYGRKNDRKKEAKNTPIQGTAAHIINRAMIRIDDRFDELKLKSGIVLQIHDQLIMETYKSELKIVKQIVREEMERPVPINDRIISFTTDCKVGMNWGEL
jgi:uracil-DNA glycosylase family 4